MNTISITTITINKIKSNNIRFISGESIVSFMEVMIITVYQIKFLANIQIILISKLVFNSDDELH